MRGRIFHFEGGEQAERSSRTNCDHFGCLCAHTWRGNFGEGHGSRAGCGLLTLTQVQTARAGPVTKVMLFVENEEYGQNPSH